MRALSSAPLTELPGARRSSTIGFPLRSISTVSPSNRTLLISSENSLEASVAEIVIMSFRLSENSDSVGGFGEDFVEDGLDLGELFRARDQGWGELEDGVAAVVGAAD